MIRDIELSFVQPPVPYRGWSRSWTVTPMSNGSATATRASQRGRVHIIDVAFSIGVAAIVLAILLGIAWSIFKAFL